MRTTADAFALRLPGPAQYPPDPFAPSIQSEHCCLPGKFACVWTISFVAIIVHIMLFGGLGLQSRLLLKHSCAKRWTLSLPSASMSMIAS